MRVSVVIATKDRAALLRDALTSLRAQIGAPTAEIVVVDNGSSDATEQVAREAGAAYVYEPEPNRGKARNRGIAAATGDLIVFCDDDVVVPAHWLRAHVAAHDASIFPLAVSGPIVNVPSKDVRPAPSAAHWSNAFFCTCNVSVRRASLVAVGGFDEAFDRYGWEDTELGVRLREFGVARGFAWDAFLWHIKPPANDTLDAARAKTLEKARMAARFVRKNPSPRARLATGAYAINRLRSNALAPRPLLGVFERLAQSGNAPKVVRQFARAQFLDAVYVDELERALRDGSDPH